MLSKKWLINICLACLTAAVGVKADDIWSRDVTIPADTTVAPPPAAAAAVEVVQKNKVAVAAYDSVVERNLFAPVREEVIYVPPEPKKKRPPKKKPAVNKKQERAIGRISVLGIVLTDDRRRALIRSGRSKKKGGGTRWIAEGDEVEGMQVVAIQNEKIRLTKGEEDVELLLYDPSKPKKRAAARKASKPTVLSTGDGKTSTKAKKKTTTPRKKTAAKPKQPRKRPQVKPKRAARPQPEGEKAPRSRRVKAGLYEKASS